MGHGVSRPGAARAHRSPRRRGADRRRGACRRERGRRADGGGVPDPGRARPGERPDACCVAGHSPRPGATSLHDACTRARCRIGALFRRPDGYLPFVRRREIVSQLERVVRPPHPRRRDLRRGRPLPPSRSRRGARARLAALQRVWMTRDPIHDSPVLYEAVWPNRVTVRAARALARLQLPADLWGIAPEDFGVDAARWRRAHGRAPVCRDQAAGAALPPDADRSPTPVRRLPSWPGPPLSRLRVVSGPRAAGRRRRPARRHDRGHRSRCLNDCESSSPEGSARCPMPGVAWQVLHHLEGLRRLGHDVFYLEDTQRWPYDPDARDGVRQRHPAGDLPARRARRDRFRRAGPTATSRAGASMVPVLARSPACSPAPTC